MLVRRPTSAASYSHPHHKNFVSLRMHSGKIIIITAPSGAGKTTIVKHLLQQYAHQLAFSVSAATRKPRMNEKDGADYYFMSSEDFRKKIREQAFVEWEMVYEDKYYGTLKSELERIWHSQKIPVLDVDVKGAMHVQEQYPDTSLSLFIMPPSPEELKRRLESRGTETADSIQTRLSKAAYEMTFCHHFNAIIINEVLETACTEAAGLVKSFINN
jgi:guanylate kinase